MPRTKLSEKTAQEKEVSKEMKDPKVMHPEFLQFEGMWRVKYTGGGRLPKSLEGRYLTQTDCQRKIDIYNANK